MKCPRCRHEFALRQDNCPSCGIAIAHRASGVLKTSAVLISTNGEPNFYRSVQEVPEPLRTKLLEHTNGENSGTIIIADQAGKDHIAEVLERRGYGRKPDAEPEALSPRSRRLTWLAWMALAFILTLGTVFSILFHIRW